MKFRLVQLRKELGLTQEEFAELIKVVLKDNRKDKEKNKWNYYI